MAGRANPDCPLTPPGIAVGCWGAPPAGGADAVRVWVVPLDTPPVPPEELFSTLPADEQARADRYRVAKARLQFVVGRGLLRRILGSELGVPPGAVPITYTGAGKPVLPGGAGPHFNVTHTDGLALIVLAPRQVGVDVERMRVVASTEGLVDRFFSPAERLAYRVLPAEHRAAGFLRGWTCKEAVLKAVGLGVMDLDGFDVELHPLRPAAVLAARHPSVAGLDWALSAWEVAPGFVAAVACFAVASGQLRSEQ